MSPLQNVALSVIAIATSAVAVKTFLPTPTVQSASQQWEYMELQLEAPYTNEAMNAMDATWTGSLSARANKRYDFGSAQLTILGKEGWEVVGVAAAPETVHYNFGDGQYVTGLQPNVRAGGMAILLKRPYRETPAEENPYANEGPMD